MQTVAEIVDLREDGHPEQRHRIKQSAHVLGHLDGVIHRLGGRTHSSGHNLHRLLKPHGERGCRISKFCRLSQRHFGGTQPVR